MDGPRIVFTRFTVSDAPKLDLWSRHSRRVIGTPLDDPSTHEHGGVVWHLTAGNHRMVARGAGVFSTSDEARRNAGAVVGSGAQLAPRMVKLDHSASYGWYALLHGEPAMTCARWYSTERDRRTSLRLAMTALGLAMPNESDRESTVFRR